MKIINDYKKTDLHAPKNKVCCLWSAFIFSLISLILWSTGCEQSDFERDLPDQKSNDQNEEMHYVRKQPEQLRRNLGKAAFSDTFMRSLVTEKGQHRAHMITEAAVIPRNANGKAEHAASIQAQISRNAKQDIITFPDIGKVTFTIDGSISGHIRKAAEKPWEHGVFLMFEAIVYDQKPNNLPDEKLIDWLELPSSRLDNEKSSEETMIQKPFFFYKEWQPSWQELSAVDGNENVNAHFAARQKFSLLLLPSSRPFDPVKHPLEAYAPARFETAKLAPTNLNVTVFGGIEPYEFRIKGLPPGLKWDETNMTVKGTPTESGKYELTIEVKDSQFASGAWQQARLAREKAGTPYQELTVIINVNKAFEAELLLPPFSRLDETVTAVCRFSGGTGQPTFKELKMPPGISIDSATGKIEGKPESIGNFPVEVLVEWNQQAGEKNEASKELRGNWKIIAPLPAPSIK